MLISTDTDFLSRRFGEEKAVQMIAEAGFDAFDYSQFAMLDDDSHPVNQSDFRDYSHHLRRIADEAGIVCNQSHAPFPSSTKDPEETRQIREKIIRSMETASILGASVIVVHPMMHLRYIGNEALLRELNLEFFRSLIPEAQRQAIQVAVENLWNFDGCPNHTCCSQPEEFCDYIDSVSSPWMCGCVDVGHASLVRVDSGNMIRKLGNKRLKALHIHDTDYMKDLHTLPYQGKIDFERITDALHDIGYQGDMTLEASCFCDRVPDELVPSALRFMADTARYLADQAEGNP